MSLSYFLCAKVFLLNNRTGDTTGKEQLLCSQNSFGTIMAVFSQSELYVSVSSRKTLSVRVME